MFSDVRFLSPPRARAISVKTRLDIDPNKIKQIKNFFFFLLSVNGDFNDDPYLRPRHPPHPNILRCQLNLSTCTFGVTYVPIIEIPIAWRDLVSGPRSDCPICKLVGPSCANWDTLKHSTFCGFWAGDLPARTRAVLFDAR